MSVVTFRDVDFRFRLAPFFRLDVELNYRTLSGSGTSGGAVPWQHRSHPIVPCAVAWKMRGTRAPATIDATWEASRARRGGPGAGEWGGYDVELAGTSEPVGRLDGFADELEAARAPTHPLAGYYRRIDVGSLAITYGTRPCSRHEVARCARDDALERLGLVTSDQRRIRCYWSAAPTSGIYLPPRLLTHPLDG